MKMGLLVSDTAESAVQSYLANPTHAVLIVGKKSTGKSTVALQLSASLLGITAQKLATSPAIRHISPIDGVISVESIRKIHAFLSLKSFGKGNVTRVVLIEDADCMASVAQNALLKLLEEPPEDTVMILTASEPQRLLNTIRSRVQQLTLSQPGPDDAVRYFARQGFSSEEVVKAWIMSDGVPGRAFEILRSGDAAMELYDMAKRVLTASTFERLTYIDSDLKDKHRAAECVKIMALITSVGVRQGKHLARSQQAAKALQVAGDALSRNANQKIVLTELMLTM